MDSALPSLSQSRLHIRQFEIIALEQKRHPLQFRRRIGDAVAEIQARLVAALAEAQKGLAGNEGVVGGEGQDG